MRDSEASGGIWDTLWGFFASVRLTIILLLSLAATSIIGTFIPQNQQPMEYLRAFGEFGFRLLSALDFFDMYRSWWFRLLILLLVLNIIVCSIERLASLRKILFVRHPKFRRSRYLKVKDAVRFDDKRAPADLEKAYLKELGRRFGHIQREETNEGLCLFAERWRWTRIGVYVVHFSIVILLMGSLVGSIFGFEGFVNIPEKETVESIFLRQSGRSYPLPFAIRCDDFDVSFYDNGAPKEFRSSLTILENDREVLQKDIIVNDPLRYRGINLFQSSYGKMAPEDDHAHAGPPDEVQLRITETATGKSVTRRVGMGDNIDLPEGAGTLSLTGFEEHMKFGGQDLGPALILQLAPNAAEATQVLLPLQFPNFDKMRGGRFQFTVLGQKRRTFSPGQQAERYYTGLQVTKDPGVPIVYTGFIGMIIGFVIIFFMSHQSVCVALIRDNGRTRVMVAGIADRNKLGMARKTAHLAERLRSL